MGRQQATENTAQERVDAAVVDAYERRIAGQAPTAEDAALEAEIAAAELSAYVTLHQRVAGLPRQDVAPSVRSVVLTAAAVGAREHAARLAPQSPLLKLLAWVMRPGPLLAAVTAAAVLVAVSVRHEPEATTAEPAGSAVAMAEAPAAPAAMAPEPAPVAKAAPAPIAAAAPAPAPAAAVPAAEPVAAPPPEAAKPAAMARPVHTIAAQAASLGPAGAPADKAPEEQAQPREAQAKREAPPAAAKQVAAKARLEADDGDALAQGYGNSYKNAGNRQAPLQNLDEAKAELNNARANVAGAAAAPNAAPQVLNDQQQNAQVATRNQVAEKASTDAVARWRQSVADAQTPEDRIAALKQLLAAAQAAGDDKTAKATQATLKLAQSQAVARKRAESLQDTPPAQRAKAAPAQGSGELKAEKAKQ